MPKQTDATEEMLAFLATLPRVNKDDYVQRAQDFIAVFAGSSTKEQGERVLSHIQLFCNATATPADADKPGTLAFKAGQSWVLAQIMRAFVATPKLPIIEDKPKNDRRHA